MFAEAAADDVQRLMYTSGTTARPKGVPLTYGNVHWKNVAHIVEFGLTSADRMLIAGPLYHVGGMDLPASGVHYVGGELVILPRFDPELVLATIERERISIVWLPPAMVNQLLAHPGNDRHDLSSLRLVISGGEKMPEPLVQRILDLFPAAWFADAYGLTETASGDTFVDRDHVLAKLGSVGRPVAHLDLQIVDDDGRPVPAGERGEIALRGPKVFSGYWRDPDRHRGGDPRRLVPHRRRRPARRRRVPLHRRPQEGPHHLRRGEHRLARGRAGALRTPRRARGCRDRHAPRAVGRGATRPWSCAGEGAEVTAEEHRRALRVEAGQVQGAQAGRLHRRTASHPLGQGAEAHAARAPHDLTPTAGLYRSVQ